ncbi:conjugal transfer protein TraI [Paracnuella aquatica]|uniref:conjugal transfer protein TraI n=1 Tax=Paracnuella aquatica TaxID=2268757 RepID=UPI000DEF2307|nr:conjugal transfer protein TraI [Paracnuella aquatica]RPD44047.1 conjugal transfer protein TraI [Paracnuella aquatica]
MKGKLLGLSLLLLVSLAPVTKANAQDPIALIIKQAIVKVIKAVDLKIQRLQNKTIWLQNAQKVIENTMSKVKLDEITDWVEKQRTLYKDYFDELWTVKNIISYYHRIKEITEKQVLMVAEYKKAWRLFKQDKNFTPEELAYMEQVYKGMLDESVKNLDQLFIVINSFSTQMTDAKRLEIINHSADMVETSYSDLKSFNQQNMMLSLQRAKSLNDVDVVKKLYGLQ